jgi:hypothetical protein
MKCGELYYADLNLLVSSELVNQHPMLGKQGYGHQISQKFLNITSGVE